MLERRLFDVAQRLTSLREELRVAEEQHRHFPEAADDARLRALVADDLLAQREHREAARHAEAADRHRRDLASELVRLERRQDELLDQLVEAMADDRP
jgi:hypothetical protein